MISFSTYLTEINKKQLNDLEKFADRILQKFDIDVEFTKHLLDRLNNSRNNPAITVSELQKLFKKIAAKQGEGIKGSVGLEVVLKDLEKDLNLPVVINYKDGEFEIIHKTIMRKKNFKTSNKTIKY